MHNSGWVQGPGAQALADPKQEARLEAYVKGVVGAFGKDARVLAWDVWNEPDNLNDTAYGKVELKGKQARVLAQARVQGQARVQAREPVLAPVLAPETTPGRMPHRFVVALVIAALALLAAVRPLREPQGGSYPLRVDHGAQLTQRPRPARRRAEAV